MNGVADRAKTAGLFYQHRCTPTDDKIFSYLSNLNVCICSLLQVLECYIISIESYHLPLIWALWIMLPAYVPNPVAALLGGGTPIDLRKNYSDGNRIFGDGKT